jgi:hypothetical protein
MARAPALSLRAQVASQAEFIVNNLRQTSYEYLEQIDVDRGIYDCDCSSFAGFVLARAAPGHYAMIPQKEPGQPRPRAFEYYEFFSSLTPESAGGWRRIDLLRDARRGDVIAWRFPRILKNHDTGHVLFVARNPEVNSAGIFFVRVYDSASKPHFRDTRGEAKEQSENGVGSGTIKFRVDNSGRPVTFQFGPADQFESLPIAIGRIEPLPAAPQS